MNFFAEGEHFRGPRQQECAAEPVRNVLAQLRVLKQVDDDCEQAEDAACGN